MEEGPVSSGSAVPILSVNNFLKAPKPGRIAMAYYILDKKYMRMALELAGKGEGKVSPNPMVGAVVAKKNTIISTGYHAKAGESHAEVLALEKAGKAAEGATLYLTLEPCCHYGKTPPCTKRIIRSGIKRVVIALKDPNPLVNGKGIEELKKAGIAVDVGLLKEEAAVLNEVFLKYITAGRPFVALKAAITLDGKIATASGESRWITGESARKYGHKLRSLSDAVMVGIGTILKDNPLLTVRKGIEKGKNPIRIIVDSKGKIPLDSRVFNSTEKARTNAKTIVALTELASPERRAAIRKSGGEILPVRNQNGQVDLEHLMKELGKKEITSVLLEGGSLLNASFLKRKLVDKIYLFIAPKIIGGNKAISFIGGSGIESLEKAYRLTPARVRKLGEDILLELYPLRGERCSQA
jgi:diaminohydroxyphosphoribosylaminopyrimidine deaminase/5-amino-6-(5-phosphoribosylamino)uracil reductase